jgi:hypothetical protein
MDIVVFKSGRCSIKARTRDYRNATREHEHKGGNLKVLVWQEKVK